MSKRKFEISGTDENNDTWVVGSDRKDTADHIMKDFKDKGYKNVQIIENKDA